MQSLRAPYKSVKERPHFPFWYKRNYIYTGIACAERDGTRAESRIRLSPKWTSPFKSVGVSVQSTAGSRGVRLGFSNDGYTTLGGGLRVLATHSIRQFPLHFLSHASPCATRFRTSSTIKPWNCETQNS